MATSTVVVFGILVAVLIWVLVAWWRGRVARLRSSRSSVVEPPPAPVVAKPVVDRPGQAQPAVDLPVEAVGFPAEPVGFVGRVETMAAAGAALAPGGGRGAVVFHGMAGVGKTTCAVELAYRCQRGFRKLVFWSAPTDPDQFDDAVRSLGVVLEARLADYGCAMVEQSATQQRLEGFLPTLRSVLADAGVLLVLDNLDTLLTPEGQWRDRRWVSLIGALTNHQGSSRVILTSRIVPAGLHPDTVVIQPVHALSVEESRRLARRLPHLRAVMHTGVMAHCVLTLTQGHPQLLKFADAAAADPSRLAYVLAEVDAVVDATALDTFVTQGHTPLDAEPLGQIVAAWILIVAATVPDPARLLLHCLCRIDDTDRNTVVVDANWAGLWQCLDRPGPPPPLAVAVAALAGAALIATESVDEPGDTHATVRYRMHPGIAEVISAAIPEPVTAAVDTQFGAWWATVADNWATQTPPGRVDGGPLLVHASLAAARYLTRRHHWDAASWLLEHALIHDSYAPATCLAVTPLLRRIAAATGALKDLVVLGAAVRKTDPGQAEILLRHAYDHAITHDDYPLASSTACDLISLLRDQNRLDEALALADQKIQHTTRAGFGAWTQLSDQGRRLQILHLLGHHEQVLADMPALRAQMAQLPDHRADNDRVDPENTREGVLDVGRLSAVATECWDQALDLNNEIANAKRRRGASLERIARIQFNDYIPLLRLGRLVDVDHLLRHCKRVFDAAGDRTQLAIVYGARASLADHQSQPAEAVNLQRAALGLHYVHPDPHAIAAAHHHLANYLGRAGADPAEQRAHRLGAALINHLTGNTRERAQTRHTLADELSSETRGDDTPALPTTLPEITRLIEAQDGCCFGKLVTALCPDPATAEHALTDLLTTMTAEETSTSTKEPPHTT